MMTAPRQLGIVRNYEDLLQIMRARAQELRLTRLDIDRLAGLTSGHAGKLLAARPIKKMANSTMEFLLPALGMKIVALEDQEVLQFIKSTGQNWQAGMRAAATQYSLSHRFLRKIAALGGHARKKSQTPKQLSMQGRRAAKARWSAKADHDRVRDHSRDK